MFPLYPEMLYIYSQIEDSMFETRYRLLVTNHHSTKFSIIIINRGWHDRSIGGRNAEWTQLHSAPHYTNLKEKSHPNRTTGKIIILYIQVYMFLDSKRGDNRNSFNFM
jgi:hypothetical protein